MEVFQRPYNGKYFPSGDAVVPLCSTQRLAVVSYDSLLPVLYLGEHSSNADVGCDCIHDEFLPWLGVGKNRCGAEGTL
jgi:hypothetical protein